MKHLLLNSGTLKTKVWNACSRGIASESVAQNIQGTDGNSTLGHRWQQHENQILIAGVGQQELELEKPRKVISEPTRREKWEEIEKYCHLHGINRSAEQCRQRWQRLLHAFSKIKHWESCRPPGKSSFWVMKASEKKAAGLLFSFDLETFNAIDAIQSRKGVACDLSDVEAVSTESPSCEMKAQKQTKENLKMHGTTRETIVRIISNEEAHVLSQASDTGLMKSSQATNFSDNDERPIVLINAINESLCYLKDIVLDACEPVNRHDDRRSAPDAQEKITESPKKAPSG